LLIIGGIIAGALAGFVLAMLAEFIMKPIRGVAQLEKMLGAAPLVVIPTLKAGKLDTGGPFSKGAFWKRKKRALD
jgi:hypothetical protein